MEFEELKGETLSEIAVAHDKETILFTTRSGREFKMFHEQDCCEGVYVEDICGDLLDLIGNPLLHASKETSGENPENASKEATEYQDSFTWTFYKLSTIEGSVTIRWYGESNGYYSEEVDFVEVGIAK